MDLLRRAVRTGIVFYAANTLLLIKAGWPIWLAVLFVLLTLFLCLWPLGVHTLKSARLRRCQAGCELLYTFLFVLSASVVVRAVLLFGKGATIRMEMNAAAWLLDIVLFAVVLAGVFWAGILRVYVSSTQIGLKWRVIGVLCGWIPVLNLVVLGRLLKLASQEVAFENGKLLRNEARKSDAVCATKYPLLLVHGVFFRDFRYLNYWGRIPKELQQNGAKIFYGNHQSAASTRDAGQEIADRIRTIVTQTGCEKVHVIAHSKGGLDARYAISRLVVAPMVASLTTVNTPHRGCLFADYLLSKIPLDKQELMAKTYHAALRKLGDSNPDFLSAVRDLTAGACEAFNREVPDPEGVYLQSVGSCMKKPSGGRFPLSLSHRFVRLFDGENDGLVGAESFAWGQRYRYLSVAGNRGISHGDIIDLNRENLSTFDVREFFVELVAELKQMGM